jgi:methionine synthase II (cobalamin-independent)
MIYGDVPRADVVGSLLRPPELPEAPRRRAAGELSVPGFKKAEDQAVDWALERLAISPQCGFATSVIGNAVSVEDEEYKLQTLVETAEQVWE